MSKLSYEAHRSNDRVRYSASLESQYTVADRAYDDKIPIRLILFDRMHYHRNAKNKRGFLFNYLCRNNNTSYKQMSSYKWHCCKCDEAADFESESRYYTRLMMAISKMKD